MLFSPRCRSQGTGSCRLNISRLSVTGVRRSVGVHVLHPPRQSDWTHGNRPAAAGTSPVKRVGRLEMYAVRTLIHVVVAHHMSLR